MRITVKSYVTLKKYTDGLPVAGEMTVFEKTTVEGVLDRLGVPGEARGSLVLMVNGRHCGLHGWLQDGDELVFYPVLEGG